MTRLLITSGDGPAECRLAVGLILRRLAEEAEALDCDLEIVGAESPDAHGPPSALALIHGESAGLLARRWTGTILWTSPSPLRQHHKRRNWFVGVFALPEAPPAPPLAAKDVWFEAFRAGGPGGQHQNVTDSAVRAVHLPTGLSAVARSERSQHRNKAAALERLGQILAARVELSAAQGRRADWMTHKALERGRPVRRFRGPEFDEEA